MDLEGWEGGKDLGEDVGEKAMIRIYCMKNNFIFNK